MMSRIPSPLDTGHRFAPITAENASGKLWIVSILCLIYCSLVLVVRLHIKWKLYGVDDATVTAATFLQLGEVIPLFIAMRKGLGMSDYLLNASQVTIIGKATFAAQLLLILSLAMAKASVAALMLRLFTRDISVTRKSRILCYATLFLILLWAVGSIMAMTISCDPSGIVRESAANQCHGLFSRWRVIVALDIITELLLVLLPVTFIWHIQLKRYIKLQVAVAFGFRLPTIIFAAVHLHHVSNYTNGTDVSKAIIPALVYQQCELCWSLISATIPTLKAFMSSFNSGFGMEIGMNSPYGYRSRAHDNVAYPLGSMQDLEGPDGIKIQNSGGTAHQGGVRITSVTTSQGFPIRSVKSAERVGVCHTVGPDTISHRVGSRGEGRISVTSDSSQEMIIKR